MPYTPFITIIIATYNSKLKLESCLQSIWNQDFANYELILIDGLSSDGTLEIILNNQDKINYWISEKDEGIYDAWNKGISKAKGDWITFIGSDDLFYPNALSDYVNFITNLEDFQKVEFISSKMDLVNSKDKLVKTFGLPWDWRISKYINTISHPGSLHKRSLFEKYGLYKTNYKICGDYEFLLRPKENLNSKFMNKVTVRMAQGGASFNGRKLFNEHYHATKNTANINSIYALYFYILQMSKYYIKNLLRFLSFNI
ncbi:glycosyltransferase family 2 protein [Pedobacter cryophilus]|uniref:Glycosyltransferase n=1 Tax=Pedobacter cryophilus TaxID=2571271 RepID=A0A4U1C510_9SPHI|nr:glycosyltransferase family 2 protein [Pedobacter cryophilus]TKC00459.1 glycosyltransferase [Pedobacter cryophilus]